MSKPTTANGANERRRVRRACDSCRLKKAKCDGSQPCASCLQRDIPCIRRSGRRGRKDLSKPHELLDTLIKAVHALHQNSNANSDTTNAEDMTTHAILESLGLIEQADPDAEAGLEYATPEHTGSPILPTSAPSSRTSARLVDLPGPDITSLVSHEIQDSSGYLPSPESVSFDECLQTGFIGPSSISPSVWQSLLIPAEVNANHFFESDHSIPPLFRTDFNLEDIPSFNSTWTADSAPTDSFCNDTTPVTLNNLFFRHEPDKGTISDQGDFGFDPVSSSPGHSLGGIDEAETINDWPDPRQYAGAEKFESFSTATHFCICASTLPDTEIGMEDNLPTISTDLPLHSSTVSPTKLSSGTTSEHSVPSPLPQRKRGRSRIEEPDDSTYHGPLPARRAHKRNKKRSSDSISARPQLTDSEKRQTSLEKNRHAASRCREKKRWEIDLLKETSHDTAAENNLLKQQATQMREERHKLRLELFDHISHPGCCKPEELRKVLDDSLEEFSSGFRDKAD